MRTWKLTVMLALAAAAGGAADHAAVAREAESLRAKLIEMRRDFHMYPELSNREERTARVITERLRALGLTDIRTGVARHGVVAMLKGAKPGPIVAFRADMDALPIVENIEAPYKSRNHGVKHACGHDAHVAVQLGVAELLSRMRDRLPGQIKFIFQPAEEGAPVGEDGGASLMVKEGALDNPRPAAIFGLHVTPLMEVGTMGYATGAMLASTDTFAIRIIGRKVHAAWPHLGIDPVVIAAEAVQALQTIRSRRTDPLEPLVVTIGQIQGGNRENIIADQVEMKGTVRALNESVRESVPTMMREILGGVTAAHGAKFELDYRFGNPVTVNDARMVAFSLPSLRRALGDAAILERPPVMGGEDFPFFLKVVPGAFFWLGAGNKARGITAMNHTPEFDIDEESLVLGVKAMAGLALDFLERSR